MLDCHPDLRELGQEVFPSLEDRSWCFHLVHLHLAWARQGDAGGEKMEVLHGVQIDGLGFTGYAGGSR